MTREEAIAELERSIKTDFAIVHNEATQMAIDALKAEPTLSEIARCCEKRGLVLVESAVFEKMKSRCNTEPVKHGRWEHVEVVHDRKDAKIQDWQQAKCSVCGRWNTTPFMYYLKLDNYCPNCGAKMDLDEVEE